MSSCIFFKSNIRHAHAVEASRDNRLSIFNSLDAADKSVPDSELICNKAKRSGVEEETWRNVVLRNYFLNDEALRRC